MPCVSELPSFLRLNTIPLSGRTAPRLSITCRWTLGLLLLFDDCGYYCCDGGGTDLFGTLLLMLWGIYLEVELLGHVVILCLIFVDPPFVTCLKHSCVTIPQGKP